MNNRALLSITIYRGFHSGHLTGFACIAHSRAVTALQPGQLHIAINRCVTENFVRTHTVAALS